MNGPTVLFNGAAIYDFAQQRYLYTAFLPESVRGHICRLLEDLPETALEIYHDDDSIHAINPNEITYHHLHLTHSPRWRWPAWRRCRPPSPSYCLRRRSPG